MASPIKRAALGGILTALLLLLAGCVNERSNIVVCDEAHYVRQEEVMEQILPGYVLRHDHGGALQGLKDGAAALTTTLLAVPAQELGIASHWTPLYHSTVVIAVDPKRVDTAISGWADLLAANETVGMIDRTTETRLLVSAMAYGLEGESYTLSEASNLLSALYRKGQLAFNDLDSPILICFDHQAAALVESGHELRIIVPREGTLSFEKGILSAEPLEIAADSDAALLAAGFRLPDGRATASVYPDAADYESASLPGDYAHLAAVCEDVTYVLKRDVQHISSYVYSSADGREHQLFALTFIILVVLWIGYVLRRVMQRGVRRTILLMTVLVIGWVLLRMFKYQIPFGTLNQYCWYGYYFFKLFLPLVGMWISWIIDRPEDVLRPPKWWHACAVVNFLLFLAIFTNNLHYQAFLFRPEDPNYQSNFTYGPLYYISTVTVFAQLFVMQMMFLYKSWKSPRRLGFIVPIAFYLLIVVYCSGYALRIPLFWETDSTIVSGGFAVIFIEACIRTGLIPVNTKYKALFSCSPLNMQIVDASGRVVLASSAAEPPREGPDTLTYRSCITGGAVAWQEDIGSLNCLHREIEEMNTRLVAANAMLMEEERIKSKLAATEARTALFSELEAEIQKKTLRLAELIETLPRSEEYQTRVAAITLLLCYIKRRCILFFRERETPNISLDEIIVYLDELGEFAAFAGVKVHVSAVMFDKLPTRRATLYYDFIYTLLDWAGEHRCRTMLVQATHEKGALIMKVLLPEGSDIVPLDNALLISIEAAGGSVALKDMDDATGVWLSFPTDGCFGSEAAFTEDPEGGILYA